MTDRRERGAPPSVTHLAPPPLPPSPPLSPEEIRSLLRECVTVVKPGETLVIRVPMGSAASQVFEYQDRIRRVLADLGDPFRVIVAPAEELGIAEVSDD